MSKEIYIGRTHTIWGNQNGEVCFETEDGTVYTWHARDLYDDLPSLIAMTHIELKHEDKHKNELWVKLGKQIIKDHKS